MKKLKGHTVIELKDVVTGEVEKIESDNLVTNAVQEFLSLWLPLLGWGAISEYFLPLYRKFFGGLYLFDTAQVESASNTFLPNAATAKLVGYAGGAATDGNDTKRGSFNFAESEELLNGYKFVWDFGTSEANGTIASISLTNPIAGYHGYHYHPSAALSSANSYTGNTPDNYKGMGWSGHSSGDGLTTRNAYYIGVYDNTESHLTGDNSAYDLDIQPERIKVKSCHAAQNLTRLFESLIKTNNLNLVDLYGKKEFDRETVSNTDQPYSTGLAFDTGSEIIIVWNNSETLYVNKYNKTTFALTDSYNVNIYTALGKYMRYVRGTGSVGATYRNGYLYLIAYDYNDPENQGYVLRFNVSTKEALIITPKFTITQTPNSSSYNRYCHALVYKDVNGNIYAGGYVIDNNDDYIENDLANPGTGNTDYVYFMADNYGYLSMSGDYYMYVMPNLQYLATINNLATPVIKTSSKVMKITYTLTEAT